MTDECRPAAGAADGSLHWLLDTDAGHHNMAVWIPTPQACWAMNGRLWYPSDLHKAGLTYHAPASPEDATERARLEGEVERLWEALRAIRDHYFEFIDNSDIDKRDAEMSAPSVLANINGIARAALTPGDAS